MLIRVSKSLSVKIQHPQKNNAWQSIAGIHQRSIPVRDKKHRKWPLNVRQISMIRFARFEKFGILNCIIYPLGRTWHCTTLLRIRFFHEGDKGSQIVTRYWMCSSFIAAWIGNLIKYERTSRRIWKLACYKCHKCSFQNYGIRGHVNWIFNSINNKKIATQTAPA